MPVTGSGLSLFATLGEQFATAKTSVAKPQANHMPGSLLGKGNLVVSTALMPLAFCNKKGEFWHSNPVCVSMTMKKFCQIAAPGDYLFLKDSREPFLVSSVHSSPRGKRLGILIKNGPENIKADESVVLIKASANWQVPVNTLDVGDKFVNADGSTGGVVFAIAGSKSKSNKMVYKL